MFFKSRERMYHFEAKKEPRLKRGVVIKPEAPLTKLTIFFLF